jgi:hypothetical protein
MSWIDVASGGPSQVQATRERSGSVPEDGGRRYRGTMSPAQASSYGPAMAETRMRLQPASGAFAIDVGVPHDDGPTWTDILRAIAVRKRREEVSSVAAGSAR